MDVSKCRMCVREGDIHLDVASGGIYFSILKVTMDPYSLLDACE